MLKDQDSSQKTIKFLKVSRPVFSHRQLKRKYRTTNIFDIKFSTLCNIESKICPKPNVENYNEALQWHVNESNTHLRAIIVFDVRFLVYNLQGGTVMSNST